MSQPVIQVDGLGKRFRLGARKAPSRTFRESVAEGLARPLRRLRGAPPPPRGEELWALRDVGFEVRQGEVVGIVGRNGAGKSTLLKILSRISEPSAGEVAIEGRLGSLLEVGTGFHPELTGRENIFLNGALLGMRRTEIRARFDEIVAFSGVERFLDTAVKHYSSGMYMRLAFAVAAHLETEILVVDEVLAVGDAQFQEKCLGKMREVGRSGRTILFVSHNMNAVEQLCQRALLFDGGRLVRDDRSVRDVIKEHLFAGGSGLGSHEWLGGVPALENPWFAPRRLCLVDAAGRLAASPLRNDGETYVQLEGEVRDRDASLQVGYALLGEDGAPLYWSLHTDAPQASWPRMVQGRVVLRSRLPPRLLNEGVYRLELIARLHHRQWLARPGVDAPGLVFTIQGGLSDSPAWNERRPGLLAPVLPWTQHTEAVP